MLDALELIELPFGEDGIEVRLLDLSRLPDFEPAAAGVLTEPELAEYAELRHPLRRREWLGARVCLKLMVVRRGGIATPLDSVVIKDPRGRPRLVVAGGGAVGGGADWSLSGPRLRAPAPAWRSRRRLPSTSSPTVLSPTRRASSARPSRALPDHASASTSKRSLPVCEDSPANSSMRTIVCSTPIPRTSASRSCGR
jgi:hypothetical protein